MPEAAQKTDANIHKNDERTIQVSTYIKNAKMMAITKHPFKTYALMSPY